MTNVYLTWAQLKNKKDTEGLVMYYYQDKLNWQIYLLKSGNAYIHYIPRPDLFNIMTLSDSDKVNIQNDYSDFETNYLPSATETGGVSD